ncbi:lipoprotein [Streptomyces mexicanus]
MPRPPAARALPAAVCAALLASATACGVGGSGPAADASASAAAASRPAVPASPAPKVLTALQAEAALLTEADMGRPWQPTQGAATWHDGVLKAQADTPACQRLLDALYSDEPLGAPHGTQAVTGYDDVDGAAQLRQRVLSPRPANVDRALAWLRTMPDECARFSARTPRHGVQSVQVREVALPEVGDARQGLRVIFTGPSDYEDPPTLTLDVAAVRVGTDAITVSTGAEGTLVPGIVTRAVQQAVGRLDKVHDGFHARA